ncbi:MAG: hypothetical protein IKI25_03635, partial [Bacteroidales bacterium]|nr:hypothetical protein [Bacteroidales bacterium]
STEHTGDLYPVYALFLSPNGSRHPGDFINLCRVELTDFHKLRFIETKLRRNIDSLFPTCLVVFWRVY